MTKIKGRISRGGKKKGKNGEAEEKKGGIENSSEN